MSKESSFDIVADFDLQEVRNAVDQVHKVIISRYDLQGTNTEITLNEKDNNILILAPDEMKLKAVSDTLLQKIINRKQSPKILKFEEAEDAGNLMKRQKVTLIKTMDSEMAKEVNKTIKDSGQKVTSQILGESIRVTSKDRDSLQNVIAHLKTKEFKLPIRFQNYR